MPEAYPPSIIGESLKKEEFRQGGDYQIDQYMYPSDLMSTDQGSNDLNTNFVVFFINAQEDSRAINSNRQGLPVPNVPNGEIVPGTNSRLGRGEIIDRQPTRGQIQAGIGTAGAIAGGVLGLLSSKNVKDTLSLVLSSAVLGTFAGELLDRTGNVGRPLKRLKGAIALNVPEQLNITYGVNWSAEETHLLQAAMNIAGELGDAVKVFNDTNFDTEETIRHFAGNNDGIRNALSAAVIRGSPGLGAMVGRAPNPMQEQVFQGVNFRDFTMAYRFYPRTPEEAIAVSNIIYEFKYHMHPEFVDSAHHYLYTYPSEFEIMYFKKPSDGAGSYSDAAEENLFIHRHTNCVLTNCEVNYTPNGYFSTHPDGMPTQIDVTLTFRELGLVTKESIEKGL